jgi:hypothetical protein
LPTIGVSVTPGEASLGAWEWRYQDAKALPVNAANAVKVYRHQEAMEFTPLDDCRLTAL